MLATADKVKNIISEHLGIEKDKLIDSARFVEDLGTDSLDAMDLLLAINEEFGLHIQAEAMEPVNTVGQLIELVKRHQKNIKT